MLKKQDADMVIAGYRHLYFGRDILKLPKEGNYETDKLTEPEGNGNFVHPLLGGKCCSPFILYIVTNRMGKHRYKPSCFKAIGL